MEDFYRELLGIGEKDIWKTYSRAVDYEHHRLNMFPNLMLCEAKESMLTGNFGRAKTILDETKLEIIDFGENYMAFNIYNAIEYGKYFILGPDETYDFGLIEHLKRAFYTKNYLEMRNLQICGKKESETIYENISNEEFFEDFIEKAKDKRAAEKRKGRLEKIKQREIERAGEFWTVFATFPLLIPYIELVWKKSGRACPFQRARFYTELLKDSGYEYTNDNSEIVKSKTHEKYFLPNFGIDELTSQEMEFYVKEHGDADKMFAATDSWNQEWIKIVR